MSVEKLLEENDRINRDIERVLAENEKIDQQINEILEMFHVKHLERG